MPRRERTPFGQRLLAARTAAGMTQREVCGKLGISQGTLSELESEALSSGYTPMIASLYGVNPYWLATGEGDRALPDEPAPPPSALDPVAIVRAVAAMLAHEDEDTREGAFLLLRSAVRQPERVALIGARLAALLGARAPKAANESRPMPLHGKEGTSK